MRRGPLPVAFAILFALSVGSVFAAPRALAQTPLPITIGYQSNVNWLLFVARDLKLFEKAGLAPNYVKFVAGAPMIEAAEGKTIDVTDIGIVPFLVGLSKGVDWTMIGISMEMAYAEGIAVRNDSGIAAFGDLKGKRIGFFKGSTAHYGLMMALRQQGIRRDQVTLLHMPPAEQLAALANGNIDAAMTWEPWLQRMDHEAKARIIATEGDFGIYANVAAFTARRDWLRENRETAVRFLQALLMAYDVMQKDRGIGIRTLAREMGIKEAWVQEIYEEAPPPNMNLWADPSYRYSLVEGSGLHRRLEYVATFLFK
ncbi:MAG: ABC transporter substrate-binding protein, partial [Deltaproteobacteria bacterium]|nr:aliphatic sulfonate ABC transporter substrate-binding protein [Candidatus Deferrimicrobiaceae bacterium]